jgi:hypothetical protein
MKHWLKWSELIIGVINDEPYLLWTLYMYQIIENTPNNITFQSVTTVNLM